MEGTVGHADQPGHLQVKVRHHLADLAVAALLQGDAQPGIGRGAHLQRRLDGAVADALHRCAAGQAGQGGGIDVAIDAHAVAADPAVGGQLEPPGQGAVVGQQQQALAVQVEPADADHAGQACRQLLEHRGAVLRVLVGGDQALGLVVAPQAGAVGGVHDSAADLHDVVGADEGGGVGDGLAVQADQALGEQLLRVAAAGDAGAGEPLGNALAAFGGGCFAGRVLTGHGFTGCCFSGFCFSGFCYSGRVRHPNGLPRALRRCGLRSDAAIQGRERRAVRPGLPRRKRGSQ